MVGLIACAFVLYALVLFKAVKAMLTAWREWYEVEE